jgi:hypothetical protein
MTRKLSVTESQYSEFGDCKEANGRTRRCVAVQPGTQRWGTEQAPFNVLKGY